MPNPEYTLIPQQGAGRGRLARLGNTVVYATGDATSAAALIGWCRVAGDRPAAEVLGELSHLTAGAKSLGPFCAVVIGNDGVDVLSQGRVPLVARTDTGRHPISDGQTHLDDVAGLDLLIGDAAIDTLLTLVDGVVAADGFTLRAVTDDTPWSSSSSGHQRPPAAPVAAPLPADPEHRPPGAAPAHDPDTATHIAMTAAMPLADRHADTRRTPAGPRAATVKGHVCVRGHFNDPRAHFCATCGAAIPQTSLLTEDVRPPLGALVMADGSYHTLVTSLLFGRDPDDDPEVREGRAQGVTLIDPGNTISRVHAEVRAVEWDVHLIDLGSTNGTFIWSKDRQQWDRLVPREPVLLLPGAHVAFGRMTATYESPNH